MNKTTTRQNKSPGSTAWGCSSKKGQPVGPFCVDCHDVATRGWACEGLDAEGVLKKLQAKDANIIKEFKGKSLG